MSHTEDTQASTADQDYAEIAKTMQALSDPRRLLIVDILSCGERCAAELQDALSMTQPATSYHMKLLADAGVITMRNEGKYVFYSLNHDRLQTFMQNFKNLTEAKPDCICQTVPVGLCREHLSKGAANV